MECIGEGIYVRWTVIMDNVSFMVCPLHSLHKGPVPFLRVWFTMGFLI